MTLSLQGVSKRYGDLTVLRHISLSVAPGEIVALLGPSGCGKTTLLRIIAGLESWDEGEVSLHGASLAGKPVHERNFGMVFQDYALFPHKDVAANVGFGLKMNGWPTSATEARVAEMLALVGLEGKGSRSVYALSGGEQQRVALARSLAPNPSLLLLDEPLGALDRSLRERLMLELRAILKQAGDDKMTIYVTHDQTEAYAIADRIVVMKRGEIEQIAPPRPLYLQPRTPFVARFLGMDNILAAEPTAKPGVVATAIGELAIASPIQQRQAILIRPDGAALTEPQEENATPCTGSIISLSFRGRHQVVLLAPEAAPGTILEFELAAEIDLPAPGRPLTLWLPARTILPLEAS